MSQLSEELLARLRPCHLATVHLENNAANAPLIRQTFNDTVDGFLEPIIQALTETLEYAEGYPHWYAGKDRRERGEPLPPAIGHFRMRDQAQAILAKFAQKRAIKNSGVSQVGVESINCS